MKTSEDSLRELWDNIKQINICIVGIPEGEERMKEAEKLFEVIKDKNFPNLQKETNIPIKKPREFQI